MAISGGDGGIILTLTADTSGFKKSINELRSEAMKLAAEYRKAGMSQSEAQKKAYRELGVTTKETEKATKATKKYGEQAQKSGGTAKDAFSKVGGAFKKIATAVALAFSVQKIIQFGKEASNLATTAEASVQRLIDIYGSASKSVGDFIDANANALGMSKSAAASYASVYGNLFSVWADQKTNASLTTQYLNMTAVVASKTGRTVEDVQERIRSGLLGNTEAIEDLGVFVNVKTIEMTDAFQRMANGKSWEQLDAYTQQQIRSMAILEQATQKYGNKVANTTALTKAQFKASFDDFKTTWGMVINTVLMPILKVLTKIFQYANAVFKGIFGISTKTINEQNLALENQNNSINNAIDNQEKLTDAIKDTAKEQNNLTAGFDELNIISQSQKTNEGQSGNTSGNNSNLGLSMEDPTKQLSDINSKASKFTQDFLTIISPISKAFKNLFKPLQEELPFVKNDLSTFGDWVSNEFVPALVDHIAEGVNSIAVFFDELAEPIRNFWNNTLKPIVAKIGEWIIKIINQTKESFGYFSEKIKEYKDEITAIIDAISIKIQLIWSVISPILGSVVDGIGNVLKTTIDFIFSVIQTLGNFFSFIGNIFQGIKNLLQGNTDDAVEYFKKALVNLVNIFFGAANTIISLFNNLWSLIFDAFKGVVNAIGGLVSKIASWFGADWDLKWTAKAPLIPLIPKWVPKLAQGAVIPGNHEFLAVLGDQPAGQTNIETPLDTMIQAFKTALAEGSYGGETSVNFTIELDGDTLYKGVKRAENKRAGVSISNPAFAR